MRRRPRGKSQSAYTLKARSVGSRKVTWKVTVPEASAGTSLTPECREEVRTGRVSESGTRSEQLATSPGVAVDAFRGSGTCKGRALGERRVGTIQKRETLSDSGTFARSSVVSDVSGVRSRPEPETEAHCTATSARASCVSRKETGPPFAGRAHEARSVKVLPRGPRRKAVG